MRKSVSFAVLVLFVAAGWLATASAEEKKMELPKPGPEQKRLERWVGTWTGEGMMQPGPMGPGGKVAWTTKCDWFDGKFAIVCKGEGSSPMGASKSLGVFTYDPGIQKYTYYGVDSMGYSFYSKGGVEGDTWNFTTEYSMEGKTYYSRFQMKELSATSNSFSESMSEDNKTWKTSFEGKETKK